MNSFGVNIARDGKSTACLDQLLFDKSISVAPTLSLRLKRGPYLSH